MSSNTDYERYDGLGLAGLVKNGSISAAELLEAAIERVEQRNPAINAVVDRVHDQAKGAIVAGLPSRPFSAVPYLLKDNGPLYAGTITTFSSSFRNPALFASSFPIGALKWSCVSSRPASLSSAIRIAPFIAIPS